MQLDILCFTYIFMQPVLVDFCSDFLNPTGCTSRPQYHIEKYTYLLRHCNFFGPLSRAGFRGAHGAQGPRPPTKRGPPTKPFNFYFALTIG